MNRHCRPSAPALALALAGALVAGAAAAVPPHVVVFDEPGFPVVDSVAVPREVLDTALDGIDLDFVDLDALLAPDGGLLAEADLFVLPHGSAFPADAWPAIRRYLQGGGNLLTLGGRPLFVPVLRDPETGAFRPGEAQSTYWRLLAAVDAAEVPHADFSRFAWSPVYPFADVAVRARRVFAVNTLFVADYAAPEGSWRGLGFFLDAAGRPIAAPVTRLDFALLPEGPEPKGHGRLVMLPFEPEPGYWESADGMSLLRQAALHAALAPAQVWVQLPHAALHDGESAGAVLHLRDRDRAPGRDRRVRLELAARGEILETRDLEITGPDADLDLVFAAATAPGLYSVKATFERGAAVVDVHETGFWRGAPEQLLAGPRLGAGSTYLERDGAPFLPVGVNAWVNDTVWPFFPENANALEWDRDFAEMAARGFTFVRTGIWFDRLRLVDSATGTAKEEVLRNLEAMLLTAGRHGLQVQFTLFVFEPQTEMRGEAPRLGPGRNPYTDPVAVDAQAAFVRSIVARFADVPFLSWDLVNEPSFSNPRAIFRGNQPNADPTELAAWNAWLAARYGTPRALAEAWNAIPAEVTAPDGWAGVPPAVRQLAAGRGVEPPGPRIGGVPLPAPEDLRLTRNGNPRQVRAVDYNLFAQDLFGRWVGRMVETIRATGSRQLVAVGQDEGGVTDRLLNQFYGGAGVDLTSLHNWWNDDALLWDSVAAKRPGMPNLLGESGPQPSTAMRGATRWNEVQGLGLEERKLAMGFAAGGGGSAVWIWSRTDPYRLGREDGSSTLWVELLTGIARFAEAARPHLGDAVAGDVALVLPQSLQLSVFGRYGLEAQQNAVRALYHHARASAYAVGEYQLDLLGDPKLILLPAPWVLSEAAWQTLLAHVRGGATLLVTGRFDLDPHFRPTARAAAVGIDATGTLLAAREHQVTWPGGTARFTFPGDKTTYLEQAVLPDGAAFVERPLGAGRILFFTLPLELADEPTVLGDVYRWALQRAGVEPAYRTAVDDPGILICPTVLDTGTLYVLTSESATPRDVTFTDTASGAEIEASLPPGRAAMVLVTRDGQVVARYDPQRLVPKQRR
jgi:hypothetical protein